MAYKDLREWIKQVDGIGGLHRVEGAEWDLEAALICNITPDMVLFDRFPGYPHGYRVLASLVKERAKTFFITGSWQCEHTQGTPLTRAWKDRLKTFKPVPPREVSDGPIMENVFFGKDVDLLRFPVPRRYEGEPRYIGTGHTVIMRDPDTDRVNLGTYRMQLHDKSTAGIHSSEGKDGRIIMEKYNKMNKPCPVVTVVGIDPGLFHASTTHLTHGDGVSELDYAGWLKGQPEEVIMGRMTGLPIPSHAEIAFEGEILPGEKRLEGPFAEWSGWSQVKEFPVVRVTALYHRDDPILTFCMGSEFRPPGKEELAVLWQQGALVWLQMELAGVREIQGVAAFCKGRLIVVSIKNLYAGHSRQAGLIASQCHAGAYGLAYVIVVDADIDPANIKDVLWAVACRTEPKRAVQILEECWASHLTMQDPAGVQKTDYGMDALKATYMSKAVIDACRPIEWDTSWHADVYLNPQLKQKVMDKWGPVLGKA